MIGTRLILVGGGGHCRSVVDVITMEGRWQLAGVLDRPGGNMAGVPGVPVLGGDELIAGLAASGHRFLITAGHVGDATLRTRLASLVTVAGGELISVISPTARIATGALVAPGCFIGHMAVVNTCASIGPNAIVNTAAVIEHDARVAAHCHVSTGAVINGGCNIGEGTLIGSGAVLLQGVVIGDACIVGAGAVVTRNVRSGTTVVGIPARNKE